jgi:hypothetical protein
MMSIYDDKSIRDAVLGSTPIPQPPQTIAEPIEEARELADIITNDIRRRLSNVLRIVNDDLSLSPGQKDAMIDRMAAAWDEDVS